MKYIIDIDGVIAKTHSTNYYSSLPNKEVIEKFNALYDEGHTIVYYTARGTVSGEDYFTLTKNQFKKWGVKYHDLLFGKPAGDIYIDDRAMNISQLEPKSYVLKSEKEWGIEYLLTINNSYAMKKLIVNPHKNISLQYHEKKHETWYVECGKGVAAINNSLQIVSEGDIITLPPGTIHQIKSLEDNFLVIVECSTPELEDIVRIQKEFIKE